MAKLYNSAAQKKHLKNPVGSLSHSREQIVGAMDLAVTGI